MIDWIVDKIYITLAITVQWQSHRLLAKLFHKIPSVATTYSAFVVDKATTPSSLLHFPKRKQNQWHSSDYLHHPQNRSLHICANECPCIIAQCHIWTPFQISQDPLYCSLVLLLGIARIHADNSPAWVMFSLMQIIAYIKLPTADAYGTSDMRTFSSSILGAVLLRAESDLRAGRSQV